MATGQQPNLLRLATAIAFAFIETLFFGGITYGIMPLSSVLRQRGVYSHLCSGNASAACPELQSQLTLAFSITQLVTPFGSVCSGLLLDRFGYRVVKTIGACVFTAGMLAISLVQQGADWLIFPGPLLIGISGAQLQICSFKLAPLTPRIPFVISSLIDGLYDASAMVFSFLTLLSNGTGYAVFLTHTGIGLAVILLNILLYPGNYDLIELERQKQRQLQQEIEMQLRQDEQEQQEEQQKQQEQQQEQQEEQQEQQEQKYEQQEQQQEQQEQQEEQQEQQQEQQEEGQQEPAVWRVMLTPDYALMALWMVCNELRVNFFIGSHPTYLATLTDDQEFIESYDRIFPFFFLCSIIFSFVPGLIINFAKVCIPALRSATPRAMRLNTVATLTIAPFIGISTCLLMLAGSTAVLIPLYVCISLHSVFLYASLSNYCISVFRPQHFGTLYTSITLISALFQLLIVPLTNWIDNAGTATPANLVIIGMLLLSLLHPAVLLIRNLPTRIAATANFGQLEQATGTQNVTEAAQAL